MKGNALIVAAVVALALGAAAPAAARPKLPPQGLYEQCAPNSETLNCGARLRKMRRAGFRYVLNYTAWFGTPQEVLHFADQAAHAGLKVIWPLNDPAWRNGTDLQRHYRFLGPHLCGCDGNADFLKSAIDLVRGHPATWGFYIGDEVHPTSENVEQVEWLAAEVKRLAPHRPTLYVAMPRDSLFEQLAPFAPLADMAGSDYYPVGSPDPLHGMRAVAETTRKLAVRHGRRPVLVLQSFSWSQYGAGGRYRFPTRREMRRMRNYALFHGTPSMLLWYSFNDISRSKRPRAHWRALKRAAFSRLPRKLRRPGVLSPG